MLLVKDLQASYSGIQALRGVSLDINRGEMTCLIGPNGAGKSTLLNCVSGVVRNAAGSIEFDGEMISGKSGWEVARLGVLQVPEGRHVFADMSVMENLQLGATALGHRPPTYVLEQVFSLFPILAERRTQLAGTLSGGQQQMLAIGRALMGGPRLLILDEPSLGLAPIIVRQVFDALQSLSNQGLTILLVEQNARLALEITARGYVLEQGRIVRSGSSAELSQDPEVIASYLGKSGGHCMREPGRKRASV
jgi:branched-chain amino acid transport system ATP-binding protein